MRIAIWKPDCQINQRDGRKNYFGNDYVYTALNRFARRLSRTHSVTVYRSGDWWNEVILCSLQSFYDVLKLKKLSEEKPRSAKIIVGGPACNNIRGFIDFIDGAYFGRCDGDEIFNVISFRERSSFWIKANDPRFQQNYTTGAAVIDDFYSDQGTLFGEREFIEKSVGCPMKCFFCHYSHWNKFVTVSKSQNYASGVAPYEDFFKTFQWQSAKRGGVTAIDGSSEATRFRVGKRITTNDLRSKILEVNESDYDGLHRVKIYNIYGYPWEDPTDFVLDLFSVVKEVDTSLRKKVLLKMQNSHFIPYVKTPMAGVRFNFESFHNKIKDFLFVGNNIKLFPGTHNQSPRLALLATIIQRAETQLPDSFFDERLWVADYSTIRKFSETIRVDLGEIDHDILENVKTET